MIFHFFPHFLPILMCAGFALGLQKKHRRKCTQQAKAREGFSWRRWNEKKHGQRIAYGALPGHGLRLPEPLPKPPNGPSPGAHVEPCPRVLMNTGPLLPRGSTKPHISRLPFMPKHTPKHTHKKGYFLYPPPSSSSGTHQSNPFP